MFHDLSKAQKRALRAAAQTAYERDTTISEEDPLAYYLDARNADLPLVVASAVAEGVIRIDAVADAARELVQDLAQRLQAVAGRQESIDQRDEDAELDPNAKVSLSEVIGEVDFLTDTATIFVNPRKGEITVYDSEVDLGENPEESEETDWVALLTRRHIDDHRIMRKFAQHARPAASRDLDQALRGRGAYRRFRDVIRERRLDAEWDAFRRSRIADIVRSALKAARIAFRE
jgi:PAS domain-containing protein